MAPRKIQWNVEVGSSSQEPTWSQRPSRTSTNACAQGNIPHPIGLTNPDHVTRYNCLNERMVVANRYCDEELLARLGMLDEIR